jgi:hypothetical protein
MRLVLLEEVDGFGKIFINPAHVVCVYRDKAQDHTVIKTDAPSKHGGATTYITQLSLIDVESAINGGLQE